ncbi:MAG TPA: mannonate dehydratase [Bryobacteraceae bacterium]
MKKISRRSALGQIASAALVPVTLSAQQEEWKPGAGMPQESAQTPKICAPINIGHIDDAEIRRIKQIGVDHVLSGGPPVPWQEEQLRAIIDKLKGGGLSLGNLMIGGFPNTLYGRPGRDAEIEKVKESIRVAGKVGLPVVEYNFYAHRAIEGYYEETGRGGAGLTAFDADRIKDLPPLPQEGTHTLEEMWRNISYFLKAVVPTAEQANVRLALHPNDPPVAISRGSGQIMSTLEGWKHLITIVDSPSNGITFDCGVTRELGHDPVEVCRYFGTRDRINHVHYRNVRVRKPYDKYTEVFIDEGENDMFAVMRELVTVKYPRLIYPEHERALDVDRERGIRNQYPGGGGYTGMVYDIAYARAMLQAALSLRNAS